MKKMKKNKKNTYITTMAITFSTCALLTLSGCANASLFSGEGTTSDTGIAINGTSVTQTISTANASNTAVDTSSLFSDRDLSQTADLSDATYLTVTEETDIHITEEGVYVLSGNAKNVTIYVEADSKDKVQLVLDGLTITNDDFPCIYVTEADKVFVTTSADSMLSVTGSFLTDGDVNTDGVIFSRCDLVLNGTAVLTVSSTDNGIVCKDDLKVTGGTYYVTATSKAFEANDSIRISDGTFYLKAGTDGIHATSLLQIDDGTFDITAAEGLEATYIQINGGTITIQASDDGINAGRKSSAYSPTVEFNGGNVTITMGAGDTDGVDSNGDIIVNGGTINVTGNSTFDYDGNAQFNGGMIIVNGQETDTIPNQMMGGMGGRGGMSNMNEGSGFGGKGNHPQR